MIKNSKINLLLASKYSFRLSLLGYRPAIKMKKY